MRKLLKACYHAIPFKRELFRFIRIFNPPQSLYKHLYFRGEFTVKSGSNTFQLMHFGHQVENEIFWEGLFAGWEKESMKAWGELVKNSQVILDIGANTGLYSMASASLNSQAEIYAFEPVPRVFEKLNKNIQLNSGCNIKAYELGISNYTGSASIFDPGTDHLLSVTINEDRSIEGVRTTEKSVQVTRLDHWIEKNNLSKIDLIKLDVEYHEPMAIEGMGKYLELFRPSFLIEILTDDIAESIAGLIKGLDYEIFDVDESLGLKRIQNVAVSSTFNLLFLSKKHSGIFT